MEILMVWTVAVTGSQKITEPFIWALENLFKT